MSAPGASATVVQLDGRSKAFRPLPVADRVAALRAGVAAYARGDFFLAHELLEPAWMGSDDPLERSFTQGLIKLAAADVHRVRGNAKGLVRNLEGAADRLRSAATAGYVPLIAVDGARLADDVERRLVNARLDRDPGPVDLGLADLP